ncbi:MAG: hypothetical protein ACTSYI_08030 [Promethearchaeota archaeon]
MVFMTIKTEHHKIAMKIENIIATIRLAERINLDLLSKKFSDIQTKRRFPGLLVRLKKPKATVLIFKSGKLVLTGVKQKTNYPSSSIKSLPSFHLWAFLSMKNLIIRSKIS